MARCMNCGRELPENAERCPACGKEAEAFLASTASPVETQLMEARLKSADLPYRRQAHTGGGLLPLISGLFAPGADFYVPLSKEAAARDALAMEPAPGKSGAAGAGTPPAPKKGGWRSSLVGFLILAGIVALFYLLDAALTAARHFFGA